MDAQTGITLTNYFPEFLNSIINHNCVFPDMEVEFTFSTYNREKKKKNLKSQVNLDDMWE